MLEKKKVLIIDEDKIFRRWVSKFLMSFGFEIDYADDASLAIELSRMIDFDIIIADYDLHGINGAEIVKVIRGRLPHSFIIGMSLKEDEKIFLDSGANAFLLKYFEFGELLSLIIPD